MKTKISLKNQISITFFQEILKTNKFALLFENLNKIKTVKNKIFFTKISLKINILKYFFKKNISHFPLQFIYFYKHAEYLNFIKKNLKQIIIFKIKKKLIKKNLLNFYFFSNQYLKIINFKFIMLSL